MATVNVKPTTPPKFTHEGAVAAQITADQELRRTCLATLLWEDGAYESGQSVADRVKSLVGKIRPERVAELAVECREKQKLRHVPLLLVREMARLPQHKGLVADTLERVIQRPDELSEFLAVYWKEKRQPLSAQVKKGLARAFAKFDEYSLAKYNRDGAVKLRDVLFLCHAKPNAVGEGVVKRRTYKNGKVKELLRHHDSVYGKLVAGSLAVPDTWEVALSGGADKKEAFTRLMAEKKLGALAFLRNLRNMQQAGIDQSLVSSYAATVPAERVLPFRFIAAARAVPQWESLIEGMMLRCVEGQEKLPGKTVILVDVSGSMVGPKVSAKSDIDRADAAAALAVLVREVAEEPVVIAFGTTAHVIPARRGFALRDAIKGCPAFNSGTNTDTALALAEREKYDRVIVITDEQSHQTIRSPLPGSKAYFINVANYKNGIGYGKWVHIDGWSESVIEFIRAYESRNLEVS